MLYNEKKQNLIRTKQNSLEKYIKKTSNFITKKKKKMLLEVE